MPTRLAATHVPYLSPLAAPPLNFAPVYTRRTVVALAVLSALSACITELPPPDEGYRRVAHSAIVLSALFSLGYVFVSWGLLRRANPIDSRYSSSAQFFLLAASAWPLAAWFGAGAWLLQPFAAWHSKAATLLSFWLGLHFSFTEHSALLQTFGVKWAAPHLWRTCDAREALLAVSILGCAIAAAVGVTWRVFSAPLDSRLSQAPHESFHSVPSSRVGLAAAALSLVALFVLAWLRRSTHSLHLHHWIVVALALPLLPLGDDLWSALARGLLMGVLVEGVAVWGFDPPLIARSVAAAASDLPTRVWLGIIADASSPSAAGASLERMGMLLEVLLAAPSRQQSKALLVMRPRLLELPIGSDASALRIDALQSCKDGLLSHGRYQQQLNDDGNNGGRREQQPDSVAAIVSTTSFPPQHLQFRTPAATVPPGIRNMLNADVSPPAIARIAQLVALSASFSASLAGAAEIMQAFSLHADLQGHKRPPPALAFELPRGRQALWGQIAQHRIFLHALRCDCIAHVEGKHEIFRSIYQRASDEILAFIFPLDTETSLTATAS